MNSCAVTLDGRRVISASDDKTLKVWDLDMDCVVTMLESHTGSVNNCAVTRDGPRVVSASNDKTLKIWDLDTGCVLTTLEGHTGSVNSCAVTPDGHHVVSASGDKTLKVWSLDTDRVGTMFEGHTRSVNSCAVTPDGLRVVSASNDGTLKVWEIGTGRVGATLEGHTGCVSGCAVTRDGRRVVSAAGDRTLKVWDLDTGCIITTIEDDAWVISCAVTPDGLRVVSASNDGTLSVWNIDTGHLIALEGHIAELAAALSPLMAEEWSLPSPTAPSRFEHFNRRTTVEVVTVGRPEGTIGRVHTSAVHSCAVTPDSHRLVAALEDKTLKVWDLDTGRVIATLEGHTDGVTGCTVIPDGRVVSASRDGTLKVWDLDTGRVIATLEGHTGGVTSCAVTPDGRCVVSASGDGTLKVWDLAASKCLATHRGDTSFTAVAVTTTTICAGDKAGTLWFLAWPPSLMRPSPRSEPRFESRPPKDMTRHLDKRRPRASKSSILFLAANPNSTSELALGKECAAIQRVLRGAPASTRSAATRAGLQARCMLRPGGPSSASRGNGTVRYPRWCADEQAAQTRASARMSALSWR